jgi:hypothetical protein
MLWLYGIIINSLNYLIEKLGWVIGVIFALLPDSPFKVINNSPIAEYLPTINYFIPISEMLTIGEAWLVAVGTYYLYQAILRWINFIE